MRASQPLLMKFSKILKIVEILEKIARGSPHFKPNLVGRDPLRQWFWKICRAFQARSISFKNEEMCHVLHGVPRGKRGFHLGEPLAICFQKIIIFRSLVFLYFRNHKGGWRVHWSFIILKFTRMAEQNTCAKIQEDGCQSGRWLTHFWLTLVPTAPILLQSY